MGGMTVHKFFHKVKRIFEFLSLLNVEPYIFFLMITYMIKTVPQSQLIQDKICLNRFHMNSTYCLNLPQMTPEEDIFNVKTQILKEVTKYSLYSNLIGTIPTLLGTLLVGSWIDKYRAAKKVLMITSALSGIMECLISIANIYYYDISEKWFLLTILPSFLSGGFLSSFTAFWAYISSTTPSKLRAIRMLVAEIVLFIGIPIGTYFGGKILNSSPMMKHGQLHNYTLVYIVSAALNMISLIWVLVRVNEKRDSREFKKRFSSSSANNIEMKPRGPVVNEMQKQFDDNKHINPLRLLFSFRNITDMVRTCCKPRANYVRLQIWLLFLTMLCYLMVHMGSGVFLFPFVERVYGWGSEVYSNASAIGNVINALSTLMVAPVLIKIIRVKDTTLSLIGCGAYFAQNIIRGVVLTPEGFYVSLLAGALGSVTSVGIRAHFSKIVEQQELGKVFSLMSAIDSVAPMVSSIVFTNLFNATMDSMPGFSFIIVAGLLVIPFLVIFWIDLYTVLPDFGKTKTKDIEEEVYCEAISDITKM